MLAAPGGGDYLYLWLAAWVLKFEKN